MIGVKTKNREHDAVQCVYVLDLSFVYVWAQNLRFMQTMVPPLLHLIHADIWLPKKLLSKFINFSTSPSFFQVSDIDFYFYFLLFLDIGRVLMFHMVQMDSEPYVPFVRHHLKAIRVTYVSYFKIISTEFNCLNVSILLYTRL